MNNNNRPAELLSELENMFESDAYSFSKAINFQSEVGGISRNSTEYIKWVQQSLNKLLNLRLIVDGIKGAKTRSAIRSFQSANGLAVDGIVGPRTEAYLIKAGVASPILATAPSPAPPSSGTTNISALRDAIVKQALIEWARWGNGTRTESEPEMRSVIINDYWKKGINFYDEQKGFDPWSGVFISYVVRSAGAGKAFRYSASHATYSYYAKQNRLVNNTGTFMAYHISEIKPQAGDLIVAERNNSGLSYDTLSGNHMDGHGDIIVEVTLAGVYVIGGNVGNSGSGASGVTVNKKRMIPLSADEYLTGSGYGIIIRAGGATASEIRTRQNEFELQPEYELLLQNESVYEITDRKSKDYIKWVQQSLNQLLNLNLIVDGVIGVKTKSAIRSFQAQQGLAADGIVGPNTEAAIKKTLGQPQPGAGGTTAPFLPSPGSALGTIRVMTNGVNTFSYQFTRNDLEWTLKFFEGETGGALTNESAAVFWAMVNRFGMKMNSTPNIWHDFTDFLRRYSTTLQPVLNSKRAAYRHINSPSFVFVGNSYYPINDNPVGVQVRRGQLKRHLSIQAKTLSSYSQQAITFAQNCLLGNTANPGIGLASEFGDTTVYFRDNNATLCAQRKAQNQQCPTMAEWETYNRNMAATKRWRWVGNIPGLQQYGVNTFFENLALIGSNIITVSVV